MPMLFSNQATCDAVNAGTSLSRQALPTTLPELSSTALTGRGARAESGHDDGIHCHVRWPRTRLLLCGLLGSLLQGVSTLTLLSEPWCNDLWNLRSSIRDGHLVQTSWAGLIDRRGEPVLGSAVDERLALAPVRTPQQAIECSLVLASLTLCLLLVVRPQPHIEH